MSILPRVIPFRVGVPIQDPADFAGRREVLQEIANAMLNLQNVSLHGERRTGKTSLLLYLAHPASSPIVGLPETHIPAYFNFQDFTKASAASVWQAMAHAVAEQVNRRHPERRDEAEKFLAIIAEFLTPSGTPELFGTGFGQALSYLDGLGFKVHLLLDEFDYTSYNPDLGDTFYDALRSLTTRTENISYVIATRTGLVALQPTDKSSSPLFNIFTRITLGPFQEDEVHSLLFDYFARADLDISLAEKLCSESPFLYDVTGYHPFFLQTLCYHLCARLDEPDWPLGQARKGALRAFEEDSTPHFEYYWTVSSQEEQRLLRMLAAKQPIDQELHEALLEDLEDRCLVVQTGEIEQEWQLFSSFFSNWVNSLIHIPATIPVPAGPFWMGSLPEDPEAHDNEKPRSEASLRGYQIGRYPVTNAEYASFVSHTGHRPPEHWCERKVPSGLEHHPVVNVNCDDAEAYCLWLSQATGRHYRLPTEEEWEKAARGGLPEQRRYPWGEMWQSSLCNTKELERRETSSVHEFEYPNQSPFGVADMAGNVWEWTASWYQRYLGSSYESLHYGRLYRVVRGGSWQHSSWEARISCRGRYGTNVCRPYLGFRIVLD